MKIAVISFTKAGSVLCAKLTTCFMEMGEECCGYMSQRFLDRLAEQPGICAAGESVSQWTGRMFGQVDGLIYIGASGIAVRAIAPYLKDKMSDPAVVVVDEQGRYAVSLLSGHVGGANELAQRAAMILGAEAVVTTASDVQGLTAIDVWAKKHSLRLADRELAKRTAAALVNGDPVGFYSDYQIKGNLPLGYVREQFRCDNVWITCHIRPEPDSSIAKFLPEGGRILRLIPRALTIGIGCRKGVPSEHLEAAIRRVFETFNLDLSAVIRIASVDLKSSEEGLLALSEKLGIEFVTFSAKQLEKVSGVFSESEFVRSVVGTGSVCERAAMAAAGEGAKLLVRKQAQDGVTVAVAEQMFEIDGD